MPKKHIEKPHGQPTITNFFHASPSKSFSRPHQRTPEKSKRTENHHRFHSNSRGGVPTWAGGSFNNFGAPFRRITPKKSGGIGKSWNNRRPYLNKPQASTSGVPAVVMEKQESWETWKEQNYSPSPAKIATIGTSGTKSGENSTRNLFSAPREQEIIDLTSMEDQENDDHVLLAAMAEFERKEEAENRLEKKQKEELEKWQNVDDFDLLAAVPDIDRVLEAETKQKKQNFRSEFASNSDDDFWLCDQLNWEETERMIEEEKRRKSGVLNRNSFARPGGAGGRDVGVKTGHVPSDFDPEAGRTWIYPVNMERRQYQENIVQTCLFNNTLVSLPTGLGKTFIAAVVMYNFYRWYPNGIILFMAPTRPLVDQQIKACYEVMGIPIEKLANLTGAMNSSKREEQWQTKRVFFATPQTVQRDLESGRCPGNRIRCLVVDEAHRCTGNYASCVVIKKLLENADDNCKFRVLGLTASPGNVLEKVRCVVDNLLISKLELRSENSLDVVKYIQDKQKHLQLVELTDEIKRLKERLLMQEVKSSICKNIAVGNSLYNALDMLVEHGMRSFFGSLKASMAKHGILRSRMETDENLKNVWELMNEKYGDLAATHLDATIFHRSDGETAGGEDPGDFDNFKEDHNLERLLGSHPKLPKLVEILKGHFQKAGPNSDTRAMVFSRYRSSVSEITDCLKQYQPLIRAVTFKGQGSDGPKVRRKRKKKDTEANNPEEQRDEKKRRGASGAMTQRMQLEIINAFKEGRYNTLVCTSVAEEGLDIGEIDLIVCYDAPSSTVQLIQRFGRTGRKRDGKITVLATKGEEEYKYHQSVKKKSNFDYNIKSWRLNFYEDDSRMVPNGLRPEMVCLRIEQPKFDYRLWKKPRRSSSCLEEKLGERPKILRPKGTTGRTNAVKLNQFMGFLDDSMEIKEWCEKFKLKPEEERRNVELLPKFGKNMVFITPTNTRRVEGPRDRKEMDLGKYVVWQDDFYPWITLQPPPGQHSATTNLLVSTIRDCDEKRFLPENSGEVFPNWKYLNWDDILRSGEKNSPPTKVGISRGKTRPVFIEEEQSQTQVPPGSKPPSQRNAETAATQKAAIKMLKNAARKVSTTNVNTPGRRRRLIGARRSRKKTKAVNTVVPRTDRQESGVQIVAEYRPPSAPLTDADFVDLRSAARTELARKLEDIILRLERGISDVFVVPENWKKFDALEEKDEDKEDDDWLADVADILSPRAQGTKGAVEKVGRNLNENWSRSAVSVSEGLDSNQAVDFLMNPTPDVNCESGVAMGNEVSGAETVVAEKSNAKKKLDFSEFGEGDGAQRDSLSKTGSDINKCLRRSVENLDLNLGFNFLDDEEGEEEDEETTYANGRLSRRKQWKEVEDGRIFSCSFSRLETSKKGTGIEEGNKEEKLRSSFSPQKEVEKESGNSNGDSAEVIPPSPQALAVKRGFKRQLGADESVNVAENKVPKTLGNADRKIQFLSPEKNSVTVDEESQFSESPVFNKGAVLWRKTS